MKFVSWQKTKVHMLGSGSYDYLSGVEKDVVAGLCRIVILSTLAPVITDLLSTKFNA
jgi:hypothetical protein